MYLLHPTGLPKLSFGSNCNPRQHLINTKKSTFIFLLSSLLPIQCCRVAKNLVPRFVSRSYIKIKWRERGGDSRSVTFVLATIVGSKSKSIYLRDFKDVDFDFTHFAHFKFAYFEIEVSFGLILVNLQNGRFHLQISILGT